jgi:hypothetical protein
MEIAVESDARHMDAQFFEEHLYSIPWLRIHSCSAISK